MDRNGHTEKRGIIGLESRAKARGDTLVGYAAIYDSEADLGPFREVIRAGAFTRSLSNDSDILCLADHDAANVLGRTKSGTLKLWSDARGLAFELKLPDTQCGRDIRALAERGDIGGMSFAFTVREGGEVWTGKLRELRDVELYEVSVVKAFPAYTDTSVALRNAARHMKGHRDLCLHYRWLETCQHLKCQQCY